MADSLQHTASIALQNMAEIPAMARAAFQQAPPLLILGILAFAIAWLGAVLKPRIPALSWILRIVGNAALVIVLVLAGVRIARLEPSLDGPLSSLGLPEQRVEGGETQVPMNPDGHFWVTARINGERARFMIDTGATVSALSEETAEAAGIAPDTMRLPILVRTANGEARADMGHARELKFGSVAARDLDVVITRNSGGLNLLGMNFLSRLKSWRVEDGTLIMTPHHAQAAASDS